MIFPVVTEEIQGSCPSCAKKYERTSEDFDLKIILNIVDYCPFCWLEPDLEYKFLLLCKK
jgi:hypothetical protein